VALVGPGGLPRPLVERIPGSVVKSMPLPEVRAGYDKLGVRNIA
jgi:hypothetical protein